MEHQESDVYNLSNCSMSSLNDYSVLIELLQSSMQSFTDFSSNISGIKTQWESLCSLIAGVVITHRASALCVQCAKMYNSGFYIRRVIRRSEMLGAVQRPRIMTELSFFF